MSSGGEDMKKSLTAIAPKSVLALSGSAMARMPPEIEITPGRRAGGKTGLGSVSVFSADPYD